MSNTISAVALDIAAENLRSALKRTRDLQSESRNRAVGRIVRKGATLYRVRRSVIANIGNV